MNLNFDVGYFGAGIFGTLTLLFWGLIILTHVFFALAVFKDAQKLKTNERLILVGPYIWSLTTLLGGVFVAVTYWAAHYSILNDRVKRFQGD